MSDLLPDLSGRRVVLIADGELGTPAELRPYIDDGDFIIAVDGGARHAASLGLTVDLLLGDFDSLSPKLLLDHECSGTTIERFPVDKDFTDTHLALNWAAEHGARDVLLLAATGSRLDQTIAHLLVLPRILDEQGIRSRVISPTNEIFPVVGGQQVTFAGRPGSKFSLVPVSEEVVGLTVKGCKYQLHDHVLEIGASLSLSNEFLNTPVTLHVGKGWLLVVIVHHE